MWRLGSCVYPGWADKEQVGYSARYAAWRYPSAKRTGLWLGFFTGYQTDALFTKDAIDWDLIACHFPDMLLETLLPKNEGIVVVPLSDSVLNVPVAKIILNQSCVGALIGQGEAASMT